jgi:hypothetical protein
MNVDVVSPLLLPFLAVAFVVFEIAGALATWTLRNGSISAARGVSFAVWFLGSAAIALVGYRQYGLWSIPPAAIAVAVSVAIVYAVPRGIAGRQTWLVAAVMVSVAAIAATAALPLSLMLLLVTFGIDGP